MLSVSKERKGTTRVALLHDGSGREGGAAVRPGQSSGMRSGAGVLTALVNAALQRPPSGTAPRLCKNKLQQKRFQPFRAEPSDVRELWFYCTLNSGPGKCT